MAAAFILTAALPTSAMDPGATSSADRAAASGMRQTSKRKPSFKPPKGYNLVWNDEFDDGAIDPTRWTHEVNAEGGFNNELQYYTERPENSFVRDGMLYIRALREQYSGPEGERAFTSARLTTRMRGDWVYGRIEVRAKLPCGQGLWPAIWMLPTDSAYGRMAASGEIDIVELIGHEPERVYGTLHYGATQPNHSKSSSSFYARKDDFCSRFHVFALEWMPREIRWMVDGQVFHVQKEWFTEQAPFPAPFDQPFHLLLNVAVGGDWPGLPDDSTLFPQEMVVDYVRVFQKKSRKKAAPSQRAATKMSTPAPSVAVAVQK